MNFIPPEKMKELNNIWNKGRTKPAQAKGQVDAIQDAITNQNLVSPQTKKEIAKFLEENNITPTEEAIHNVIYGISLNKIFKKIEGEEILEPDLKQKLQKVAAHDEKALQVIADALSQGSKKRVDHLERVVMDDLNEISRRSTHNPELFFNKV